MKTKTNNRLYANAITMMIDYGDIDATQLAYTAIEFMEEEDIVRMVNMQPKFFKNVENHLEVEDEDES